jgi:hypothetical protein
MHKNIAMPEDARDKDRDECVRPEIFVDVLPDKGDQPYFCDFIRAIRVKRMPTAAPATEVFIKSRRLVALFFIA